MRTFVATVMVLAFGSACDVDDGDGPQSFRGIKYNSPAYNGVSLNGVSLNGVSLNTGWFNGVYYNGVSLNGVSLNGVSLNGTTFSGWQTIDGQDVQLSGTELIGMRFRLVAEGRPYMLAVDDIYKNPADPDGDVYFYEISVFDEVSDSWTPLCNVNDQPAAAIPLQNYWDEKTGDRIDDPEVITFACRGAVLAKCVEFGYEPWSEATRCDAQGACTSVSLADYHQACTRMTRADYCGDGTSYTVTGTLIDIFDPLSPHLQTRTMADHPSWGTEAEWGPDGALCVGSSLRRQLLDDLGIGYDDPECLAALTGLPDCGQFPDERGALIGNGYCTQWGTDPEACY